MTLQRSAHCMRAEDIPLLLASPAVESIGDYREYLYEMTIRMDKLSEEAIKFANIS